MGCKGEGHVGKNNKGLINPTKVKFKRCNGNTSLGFKKTPFQLGKKKCIHIPEKITKSSDDEHTFPYPIPQKIPNILMIMLNKIYK